MKLYVSVSLDKRGITRRKMFHLEKKKNLPKDHLNRTIQQAVREMYLKIFVLDI